MKTLCQSDYFRQNGDSFNASAYLAMNPADFLAPATAYPNSEPSVETRAVMQLNAQRLAGQPVDLTSLPPADGRALAASNDAFWNADLPPELCQVVSRDVHAPLDPSLGGARSVVLRHYNEQGAKAGSLIYFHGGGWAFGNINTHDVVCRALAVESGLEVISVDYRLAPEHPHPAPLYDCVAAWRWVQARRHAQAHGPESIVLAGDSAGAALAIGALLHEADRPVGCAGALLFYGAYSTDYTTASHSQFGSGAFGLSSARMKNYVRWYVGDEHCVDPLAFALNASAAQLRALPPLFLTAAGLDCLRTDSELLAARLSLAGHADHRMVTVPGVLHGHLLPYRMIAATRQLIAEAARESKRMLHRHF